MKIVVLAGGLSPERNISLSIGTVVTEALRALGHRVSLIDLYFGPETDGANGASFDAPVSEAYKKIGREAPDLDQVWHGRKGDSPSTLDPGVLELCQMADMVFLALRSTCGGDGQVQTAFDLMGIPYTDAGYLGGAIAMDKNLTKWMTADVVSTPGWKTVTYTAADIDRLVEIACLPLVVKPVASGSFIGISIARTMEELRQSLTEGLALEGCTVLEEYIRGQETQVGILEDKTLPSIRIIPRQDFYGYASEHQSGAALKVCPAEITPGEKVRVRAVVLWMYETLGLSVYSHTDFVLTKNGKPWFLEINTLPGMTPTSLLPQETAAAGIGYNELCQRTVHASPEA